MRTALLSAALVLVTVMFPVSPHANAQQAPTAALPPAAAASTVPSSEEWRGAAAPEDGPRMLAWGAPAPLGYRSVLRPRRGLLLAGIWVLTGTYTLSATIPAFCKLGRCSSAATDTYLLIPGLGPFVQLARTQNATGNVLLTMDGLVQVGGVGLIVAAYAFRQEVFVKDASTPHFIVAPLLGAGERGLGVVGEF